MNTFKQKSLYAALAGVSALGVTGAAQAVNVNPDGLGQVLIYPYYTVQNKVVGAAPFSSLLSVVNSTVSAKAVKVRFLEGRNSAEVLDFNLFLSAKDVWTAAVVQVGVGAGVGSFDKSCTVPTVGSAPTPFVNFAYAGDGAGDGLDRTREGYIEIIEMGVVTGTTAVGVTHKSGVPPCTALDDATVQGNIIAPTGGLFGGLTMINVLAGEDFTADAVALDNFRTSGKYDPPGGIKPDLRDVAPATAVLFNGQAGVITSSGFAQNVDAVSALFMHDHVYSEYVLDTGTKSGTDWVITSPTKRYYYDSKGVVQYLFQKNFGATGACDEIGLTVYDREEQTPTAPQGFSPPPPAGKKASLCWEANVLTFNGTNVLGSANSLSATVTYQNGWADLLYTQVVGDAGPAHELRSTSTTRTALNGTTSTSAATYIGLPVIGFAVQSFDNGTIVSGTGQFLQSKYGGNFVHKFTRKIN